MSGKGSRPKKVLLLYDLRKKAAKKTIMMFILLSASEFLY